MNVRSLILACFLGVGAVGFSMHGQGGGVLYTPLQVLFGVDFHTAALQSLWFTVLTALPAALLFRKALYVDWALALALESSSFVGAFASGYFAKRFRPQDLTVLLALLVLAAAWAMWREPRPWRGFSAKSWLDWTRERAGKIYRVHLGKGLSLSFLIGVASGFTGAAGGFLKIPMLVRLFGVPVEVAFGSSAFMVTLTAAGGLLGHLATGQTAWHEPLLCSVFVLIGSQIGPRLTMRSQPVAMRRRFAGYLLALACLVLVSAWFVGPAAGVSALS